MAGYCLSCHPVHRVVFEHPRKLKIFGKPEIRRISQFTEIPQINMWLAGQATIQRMVEFLVFQSLLRNYLLQRMVFLIFVDFWVFGLYGLRRFITG